MLFAALAGGMAWGIRGQYGHETGAMMAGLLVSLVLTFLLCPGAAWHSTARAVALCTIAMGFGGSMTYGQTVGLTHDPDIVGNWGPLWWGFFGLAIKGGLWIGFAGVFLGMGLGGVKYRAAEMLFLMLAALGAYYIGVRILNYPFNPAEKQLPYFYFSDDWRWEPNKDLEPRREMWGGLLFALTTVIVYASAWRKDRLARNMAFWGILGGVLGFPIGQSLQAYHAWNPEIFDRGIWENLDNYMNWWNHMETTFGAIMGACLGLGLWLNRNKINLAPVDERDEIVLPLGILLLAIHIPMLAAVEFLAIRQVDALYDLGLIMGIIPLVCVAGTRWWPYLVIFPIILIPIAGKTLRNLGYEQEAIGITAGWIVYVVIPLTIAVAAAFYYLVRSADGKPARAFTGPALLIMAWMFFLLNYAFFRFPFPWAEWTRRTPNGIVFTICVLGLTAMVLVHRWRIVSTEVSSSQD